MFFLAALFTITTGIQSQPCMGAPQGDIPVCKLVKDSKGTPRLSVNGKIVSPDFFFGNNQVAEHKVIFDEIDKAAKTDVNYVQMIIDLPWAGTTNKVLDDVVKANPNAMICPWIYLHPPKSWIDAHPNEITKIEGGKIFPDNNLPSLASDVFIKDCKKQLEQLINSIQTGPHKNRIMGYIILYLSGGEWFYTGAESHYFDYSEVNRLHFVDWSKTKYKNKISNLNAAWKKNYKAFNEIQIPVPAELEAGDDGLFRNPSLRRAEADYLYYFNDLEANRVIEIADTIKAASFHKSLVGFYYGYQLELISNCYTKGVGNGGHMGLRKVLASPNIDLLCSPVSYLDRQPGHPNGMMSIVDSVTLAGKIYQEQDDARTWLIKPPSEFEASLTFPTEWDSLQCLRRNYGNVVGHNQSMLWFDLTAGGNMNAESIWKNNKILIDTYKDSIENQQPTVPQVALIYNDDYYQYLKADCLALTKFNGFIQRGIFQSLGAQVGYYFIQDLPKIPSSVKLYVFVNTVNIDAKKKALIDGIKKENKTLLWLYAPGYSTEKDLSLANMREITGFNFGKQDSPITPFITVASNSNPICQGIAGKSFGSISGVTPNAIAPTFYGKGSDGSITLGNYDQGNRQPALLLKEFPTWRSIFCGAPILSVPVLRSICRYAGAPLLVDPDNMLTEDAVTYNGRYLYVYARTHAGERTFRVPEGAVTVVDVLTGKQLGSNVTSWKADFKQNEQKIFKVVPASSARK